MQKQWGGHSGSCMVDLGEKTAKTVIIATKLHLQKPDSLENIVTAQWGIVTVAVVQATSPEFHSQ